MGRKQKCEENVKDVSMPQKTIIQYFSIKSAILYKKYAIPTVSKLPIKTSSPACAFMSDKSFCTKLSQHLCCLNLTHTGPKTEIHYISGPLTPDSYCLCRREGLWSNLVEIEIKICLTVVLLV